LGAQNNLEVVRLIHKSYIGITYICREMDEAHPFPSICRVTVWPFEVTLFHLIKPEREGSGDMIQPIRLAFRVREGW